MKYYTRVFCIVTFFTMLNAFLLNAQIQNIKNSVVKVVVSANDQGTGIIIRSSNDSLIIITAYHVIKGASMVGVIFNKGAKPIVVPVNKELIDTRYDIAILVQDKPPALFPAAIIGSTSDVKQSDDVFAIGHPQESERGWDITKGIVNNFQGTDIVFSGEAVNEGNSGGLLLNKKGYMVGMIYELSPRRSRGYAVGSDVIKNVLNSWEITFTEPNKSKPIYGRWWFVTGVGLVGSAIGIGIWDPINWRGNGTQKGKIFISVDNPEGQ